MNKKHLKLLFSLLSFLFVFKGYSQLGIPLISQQNKCKAFKEIQLEEKIRINEAFYDGVKDNDFSGAVNELQSLLNDTEEPLTTVGKLYTINKIIDIYLGDIEMDDSCIYNLTKTEYGFIFIEDEDDYTKAELDKYTNRIAMATKGYEIINNYFEKALEIADDESKEYFKKKRLYYIVQSELIHEQYVFNFTDDYEKRNYWEFENLSQIIDKGSSKGVDMQVFKQANSDYNATKFDPYTNFMGLNFGFSSFYGKDLSIGGEVSVDQVEFANPFKMFDPVSFAFPVRVSALGIGYHKNMTTGDNDFSFFASRITNFGFINLTPSQFGFKWGPSFTDDKKYWYYRPEIGFTYAIFTVSYGYNLMFNKDVRGLTDKSVINFKISYPLIQLSR